jgi:hypothetical protein
MDYECKLYKMKYSRIVAELGRFNMRSFTTHQCTLCVIHFYNQIYPLFQLLSNADLCLLKNTSSIKLQKLTIKCNIIDRFILFGVSSLVDE